jgi:hypothetical protein
MAHDCEISDVPWFIFFHKLKMVLAIPSIPAGDIALTGNEFMKRKLRRKRIRVVRSVELQLCAILKPDTNPELEFCGPPPIAAFSPR